MIIKSVRVQNFRSILDETLPCDQLTALVGANGSGKSCFLRALDLFYHPAPRVGLEDFYAEDITRGIEIAVTFGDLSAAAVEHFDKYVENSTLTVVRVFSMSGGTVSPKYHGSALQNPDFVPVRDADKAADKKSAYQALQEGEKYTDLPRWAKTEQGMAALKDWEQAHQDQCVRSRDDGQFFGFSDVGRGYLGRYTRFIFIPAVRDAADDSAEGKGTPITELMDLVVRSALASRTDLTKLKEETQRAYDEIMDPTKLVELSQLGDQLSSTLKTYVPDARVNLFWLKAGGIEIPMPKAAVKLVEDGYPTTVVRTGHGLQRAFILTLLQHLALARVSRPEPQAATATETTLPPPETATAATMPNLVLCVEEPELYQHPNRQRHFARILLQLSTGLVPGVAAKTQVIYATHSPLFVGTDRFDQVRLLRKRPGDGTKPKVTGVVRAVLSDVATELWTLNGSTGPQFTADTLRPRLQAIMTPWMNEGFFSDVVVLVEGEDDRAALLGVAAAIKPDFPLEAHGFAIIPCMGKRNLDRPAVIFRRLGIPTYVVWDSDEGKRDAKASDNRYLLRLCRETEEDWPERVSDRCACFKKDLETTIRTEIGPDDYDRLVQEVTDELGLATRDQAMKNPRVVQTIIERARMRGKTVPTLEAVLAQILALKPAGATT